MKKNYFIKHDFYARNDEKLIRLRMSTGMNGIGIFWCLVEILYENGGTIKYDPDAIIYDLRCEKNDLKRVVEDFGLFTITGDGFITNNRVSNQIKELTETSERNKQIAVEAWKKKKQTAINDQQIFNANCDKDDTNALKNEYECKANVSENECERKTNVSNFDADKIREDKKRKKLNREGDIYACEKKKPTYEEVIAYGEEQMFNPEFVVSFWEHYEASGWIMGNGIEIQNWRARLKTWVYDNELKHQNEKLKNNSRGGGYKQQRSREDIEQELQVAAALLQAAQRDKNIANGTIF